MQPDQQTAPASAVTAPVSPWVNIAMRALDTSVASSQHLLEGVDRLARAGAGVEVEVDSRPETLSPAVWGGTRAAVACGIAMAAAVQRSAVTMLADGWRRWMESLDTVAAGLRGDGAAHAAAASGTGAFATPARRSGATGASRGRSAAKPARARSEHATASAGSKRRTTRRKSARESGR